MEITKLSDTTNLNKHTGNNQLPSEVDNGLTERQVRRIHSIYKGARRWTERKSQWR